MNSFKEEPILWVVGKVLIITGTAGGIVTIFFDKIAGRIIVEYGWVQITGMISFCMLVVFGMFIDSFMTHDIIPMIKRYLEK